MDCRYDREESYHPNQSHFALQYCFFQSSLHTCGVDFSLQISIGNNGRVPWRVVQSTAYLQGCNNSIWIRPSEENDGQPCLVFQMLRGIHHSMQVGYPSVIGPLLYEIPSIDDKRIPSGIDWDPFGCLWIPAFQPPDFRVRPKEGKPRVVSVRTVAQLILFGLRFILSRVVSKPEGAVRICVVRGKILRRQSKRQCRNFHTHAQQSLHVLPVILHRHLQALWSLRYCVVSLSALQEANVFHNIRGLFACSLSEWPCHTFYPHRHVPSSSIAYTQTAFHFNFHTLLEKLSCIRLHFDDFLEGHPMPFQHSEPKASKWFIPGF